MEINVQGYKLECCAKILAVKFISLRQFAGRVKMDLSKSLHKIDTRKPMMMLATLVLLRGGMQRLYLLRNMRLGKGHSTKEMNMNNDDQEKILA